MHAWFDQRGEPPPWLGSLGRLTGYRQPPHHSKFRLLDPTLDIMLTGSPDGVLVRSDDSHVIVDYKTAKFTGTQDELYPMYETQLNVYARLGAELGFAPVSGLALIYMEPVTDDDAAAEARHQRADGFAMGFKATILEVPINRDLVPPLLLRAREIYDLDESPSPQPGCKNCSALARIADLVGSQRAALAAVPWS